MIQADRLCELREAQDRKKLAEQNFNNAAPKFVKVAAFELKAAELRYNAILHEVRILQN